MHKQLITKREKQLPHYQLSTVRNNFIKAVGKQSQ